MPSLAFRHAAGLTASPGRGIGFLEGHPELDAGMVFDGLTGTEKRQFMSRMDRWLSGLNSPSSQFHGFTSDPEYKECFAFKYKEHRLYGFLCNPLLRSNPRFRLCVLCIHATKHEKETDYAELDRVNQWRINLGTKLAIAASYPEYGGVQSKWKN
jgi:hypothetical protein